MQLLGSWCRKTRLFLLLCAEVCRDLLGAGIATAVSGYLVAHLGGFLSWPSQPSTPTAAIEVPANATAKTTERHRNRATASEPAETDTRAASVRDEHSKEAARPAAKPAEVSAPAATTATGALDNDEKRSRAASASRKPIADAHAAKPAPKESADLKPAPKETAEAKAHEEAAVEDQVRAALANVDASRTPTPPAMTPAPQTAAIPQPQPIPAPSNPAGPAITALRRPRRWQSRRLAPRRHRSTFRMPLPLLRPRPLPCRLRHNKHPPSRVR